MTTRKGPNLRPVAIPYSTSFHFECLVGPFQRDHQENWKIRESHSFNCLLILSTSTTLTEEHQSFCIVSFPRSRPPTLDLHTSWRWGKDLNRVYVSHNPFACREREISCRRPDGVSFNPVIMTSSLSIYTSMITSWLPWSTSMTLGLRLGCTDNDGCCVWLRSGPQMNWWFDWRTNGGSGVFSSNYHNLWNNMDNMTHGNRSMLPDLEAWPVHVVLEDLQ